VLILKASYPYLFYSLLYIFDIVDNFLMIIGRKSKNYSS